MSVSQLVDPESLSMSLLAILQSITICVYSNKRRSAFPGHFGHTVNTQLTFIVREFAVLRKPPDALLVTFRNRHGSNSTMATTANDVKDARVKLLIHVHEWS